MSVYKPKGSPYFHYDFVWKGRRYHGSTGLEAKRQAEAYERNVRSDAVLVVKHKEPISLDIACGYYADHAQQLPSWKTIRYMLDALVSGLGKNKLLSEITQHDLLVHFAKRRAGRSNSSVNREIENARSIWVRVNKARVYNIGEMPDWKALFLKVAAVPPRELSMADEPLLFAHIRADMIGVCDFALKSGWRLGEVIGLRWSDCDFQTMQATTKIKGGDTVKRPLTPTLIAIVANQPKVGAFVFTYVAQANKSEVKLDKLGRKQPARKKGERYPMTKTALRGVWEAAKDAAGIDGLRFHDLRHTRGTRIVRATGSLAAAKSALKHTRIETTLRYAHVLDDDVRNALDASEAPDAGKSRTIPEASQANQRKRQ